MREWSLSPHDPLSLRIAADARQTIPNYVDDQIWEISLQGGDPQAIGIETSYGLRAQRMRIFPGFSLEGGVVINPDQFAQGPVVRKVFPDYVRIECEPFDGIAAHIEFWARESNLLHGRLKIINRRRSAIKLGTRLYAQLRIGESGEPLGEWQFKGVVSLIGRVVDMAPLIFITGGARVDQSIYPSLIVDCNLEVGEENSISWVHVGLEDHVASFEAARAAVATPWEAEIAKLELLNSSMVDIRTGDPDWDAAFLFSQTVAIGAYVGPTKSLPHPSFVLLRTPDRGYSTNGDGSDYALHWDGQSALHAYTHIPQLLPAAPELAKGVIRNFLAIQKPRGHIDWKPGLGGQRNGSLAVPLLATLAWRIYEHTEDIGFLEESFEALISFLNAWFGVSQDRDGDGFPEWDHVVQMGYADSATFTPWKRWGQGLEISTVESPDLASYLVRECKSLTKIANVLGLEEPVDLLHEHIKIISKRVEKSWDGRASIYRHVDRDTHLVGRGEVLGSGEGEYELQLEREFKRPVRIVIRSEGDEAHSHAVKVFIHGRGDDGQSQVEKLRERHYHWFWGIGTATSETTYQAIDQIELRGLSGAFRTEILSANHRHEEAGLLLPLWAGIPSRERADRIITKTLLDGRRFFRTNGIASLSAVDPAYEHAKGDGSAGIDMFYNTILGEALVDHGYLGEAADLVQRLMGAVIAILKNDGAFRETFDPDNSRSFGEKDHLMGLAPFGLFMKTMGIELISQNKIVVRGENPFPWPVTVRWKGITIECEEKTTKVEFPDGSGIEVTGEDQQLIER
jgi:hypothetical protein